MSTAELPASVPLQPFTAQQLADALDLSGAQAYVRLKEMRAQGLIRKVRHGWYERIDATVEDDAPSRADTAPDDALRFLHDHADLLAECLPESLADHAERLVDAARRAGLVLPPSPLLHVSVGDTLDVDGEAVTVLLAIPPSRVFVAYEDGERAWVYACELYDCEEDTAHA